jgi:hypothetical protein
MTLVFLPEGELSSSVVIRYSILVPYCLINGAMLTDIKLQQFIDFFFFFFCLKGIPWLIRLSTSMHFCCHMLTAICYQSFDLMMCMNPVRQIVLTTNIISPIFAVAARMAHLC